MLIKICLVATVLAGTGLLMGSSATDGHSLSNQDLVAQHSNKCIDILSRLTGNGANAIQYTCNGGYNQLFDIIPSSGAYHEIKVRHSGKCLDVKWASTSAGATIWQWECNGTDAQKFGVQAACSG